jgi:hypothetical protein
LWVPTSEAPQLAIERRQRVADAVVLQHGHHAIHGVALASPQGSTCRRARLQARPAAAQWITYVSPLTYFLVIIRGIFLEGSGLSVLWPQFVTLALLGVVLLGASSLRFRKRTA